MSPHGKLGRLREDRGIPGYVRTHWILCNHDTPTAIVEPIENPDPIRLFDWGDSMRPMGPRTWSSSYWDPFCSMGRLHGLTKRGFGCILRVSWHLHRNPH